MPTTAAKPTIPRGCFRPDKLPAKWRAVLDGVPGYDPTKGSAGCWFDPTAAQLALDFFPEMLCHVEGALAGHEFRLEAWQQSFIANLFGWKKRNAKGRIVRRFREVFLYIGRKGGKTPTTAGIGLFVFFVDDEAGQQGFITAKDREQAGLLFRQMDGMVRANPELASRCQRFGGNAPAGQSRSFVKGDSSFLKVISGDGSGKHGGNPHLVIVDELHEQDSRELIDALQTSMVSENRDQSLFISITTADYDRPSICNEKYAYAKQVRDNPELDPAYLPVIFEADPTDDPYSVETWRKANPNLGVSVSIEALEREATKAKLDPAYAVEFKRLFLNIRTKPVVENSIDLGLWDACGSPLAALDGRPCWGGLDYGWSDDYAAFVLVFPETRQDTVTGPDGHPVTITTVTGVDVVPHFWVPKSGRRDLTTMPAASFVAANQVTVTPGNATDVEAIYEAVRAARRKYELRRIAYDLNNARAQGQQLMREGFDVMEFFQNKRNFSEPWKWMMSHGLKDKKLRHGGHPVLRWMISHCSAEVDGTDGVMPKKNKSADKIDGVVAMLMGLAAWLADPNKDRRERLVSWI